MHFKEIFSPGVQTKTGFGSIQESDPTKTMESGSTTLPEGYRLAIITTSQQC